MPRSPFPAGALIAVAAALALSGCGSSSATTPTPTAAVGNNSSAFCTQAGQVDTALTGVGSALAQTPGATPDLNTLKQLIATGANAFDSLDSQAPSDIASAFHTLRTAYDQANTAAQSATSVDQLSTTFASFGTPAVASAASEITAYIVTKCGFTPGASTAATPTPT